MRDSSPTHLDDSEQCTGRISPEQSTCALEPDDGHELYMDADSDPSFPASDSEEASSSGEEAKGVAAEMPAVDISTPLVPWSTHYSRNGSYAATQLGY